MDRTVKIDDRTYTVAPLRFGQAREIFSSGKDAFDANCEMVAACLNNGESSDLGGKDADWTADKVKDLPYPDGQALMLACLEINGLKKVGEEEAAQVRADSRDPAGRDES
jgi:hypothetical protein